MPEIIIEKITPDIKSKLLASKPANMIPQPKSIIKNGNIHKIGINNIMDSNTKNKIEFIKKNITEPELIRLFNKVNISIDIVNSIDNIYFKIKDIQQQKNRYKNNIKITLRQSFK